MLVAANPVPVVAYPPSSSPPVMASRRGGGGHSMSPLQDDAESSTTTSTRVQTPGNARTVMVTGANGYLASYIVKDLLCSGHTVHACVRDASKEASVEHLKQLTNAKSHLKLFSTGDLACAGPGSQVFDAPMKGCDAIIHSATPLSVKFGSNHSGKEDIFNPAMISTQELLDCLRRHANTVRCLVLTSSMAAVAPRPEPAVKDESHWSDPVSQQQRDNWYGCTKTSQEQLVKEWITQHRPSLLSPDFVYAAICPTMVIGPQLRRPTTRINNNKITKVDGTMGSLQKWLRGGKSLAPNDSMSFIHVQDCARMHTRILQLKATDINQHARYMSLIESLHWNDILQLLRELYPNLPPFTPYQGDDKVKPTQFNLDNMQSLLQQQPVKTTREALQDSIDYLNQIGALD
ncbi:Tetraketide alpha-pyrone reductase [Seminavis robusta]|uniref:Tetraketide alpha-pyrone reductase n=1 Tax=Seminavis robusta TaxID=568900 RepID=A0A9N8D9P6_9STRA|nr:Tetraketide alpha-pyrone reductase [Seminavis robusta]|eukprot:Sro25_g017330.1 Tetraketide alpha-pyrone reductase (404) ;mRNA; r:157094-158305